MAASDRILAVVVEAVAKLKKRLDVVESASPVAGIDGRDGVDGADASDDQVAAAAEKWLSENISQPADGKDAALDDIRNAVERYIAENPPRDGADGKPGKDGNNGISVTAATVEGDELFITLDSGDVLRAGNVRGIRGPKGDAGEPGPSGPVGASGRDASDGVDGRGIEAVDLDTDGHLILKFTDGEEIDVGRVVGRDGKDGVTQTVVRSGGSGGGSGGSGGSVAPTPAPAERISLIAEQPIIAYKVVTTNDAGQGIYADASTRAHVDQVIGLAAAAAAAGSAFEVIESGFVTNSGWSWTAGEPLFLGNTGDIVRNPTAGVFTLQIGYARSSTEIYLRIGRGVLRA